MKSVDIKIGDLLMDGSRGFGDSISFYYEMLEIVIAITQDEKWLETWDFKGNRSQKWLISNLLADISMGYIRLVNP